MKTFILFLLLVASTVPAFAEDATPATEANTRVTNPSALVVEILGRGLAYSVGYDQVMTPNLSVGVGFSTAATEVNGVDTDKRAYMLPVYVNYYFNPLASSLFITGGADVILNSNSVKNYEASTSKVDFPKDALMPTFGAGWEHRGDSGFLFRVTGYGIAGDTVKPWAGFTFGWGF